MHITCDLRYDELGGSLSDISPALPFFPPDPFLGAFYCCERKGTKLSHPRKYIQCAPHISTSLFFYFSLFSTWLAKYMFFSLSPYIDRPVSPFLLYRHCNCEITRQTNEKFSYSRLLNMH